eukprot:COSAG05_NODE_6697_length_919_cov_1.071951_1_plen_238_part_00
MALLFDGINLKDGNELIPGKLRVAPDTLEWTATEAGAADGVAISSAAMKDMLWMNIYGGRTQLKCLRSNDTSVRFVGSWDQETYTQLVYFVKENYSVELKKVKVATKGWNWGSVVFEGETLSFEVDGKEAFDVPLGKVSQVQENKHEVALDFHSTEGETTKNPNDEELVEMRFLVPPTQSKDDNGSPDELTPAQDLMAKIRDRAAITSLERDGIVQFKEINFVTPRCAYHPCKFDID